MLPVIPMYGFTRQITRQQFVNLIFSLITAGQESSDADTPAERGEKREWLATIVGFQVACLFAQRYGEPVETSAVVSALQPHITRAESLIVDAIEQWCDDFECRTWTREDEAAATSEGWGVFEANRGQQEIQRIDERGVFDGDAQAIMHVYDKALRGSALHRKAMNLVLAETNVREKQP